RSRSAAMNLPLGTAAIERTVTFTIGTGLMAIPDIRPDVVGQSADVVAALSARIAADYDEYMSSTDPDAERSTTGYGLQDIILRGVLEAGDILQVRVMPEEQVGRTSTTAWKLVEADRIVSPTGHIEGKRAGAMTAMTGEGTGNVIVGGVELDEYGAPIAFHVLRRDPGIVVGSGVGRIEGDTVRVPAWGGSTGLPSAMLVMTKRRADQARGVPMLAPVLEVLRQISTLTEAELFAAILTGMLAIVHKSPGASPLPEPDYGQGDGDGVSVDGGLRYDDAGGGLGAIRFEQGTVLDIDTGSDVEMKTPGRPNPAFDPFFIGLARQLSAAIEIPVEVLLLHFLSSYTASRAAFETFYQKVRGRREWMASASEAPRYRAWLYEQVARGRYRLPGFLTDADKRAAWSAVRFRGDGKISMDPAREAKALEVHEAHAWRTGAEITAELTGGDYDANVRVRIGEHQRFVEGTLPIPNAKGGGNAPASDHQED
ncbi:MAG: phage portal protein, partial [Sphingomonadales bacterium]|nr:phage portal protein [Sphingomonadales bacterium]